MDGLSMPLDHFMVEDLLDFPNDECGANHANIAFHAEEYSSVTAVDSCNSSLSGSDNYMNFNSAATAVDSCNSSRSGSENYMNITSVDATFSNELCVPFDDLAELEWLSNFVEDSFSSNDLQNFHLISGAITRPGTNANSNPNPGFYADMKSVPAKARSKRSRAPPMDWASRVLLQCESTSPEPDMLGPTKKLSKQSTPRKQAESADGRKCQHCATMKTPQWRTGPMGPKTLCNACGVRYKSGRLVPEYRPAASPTFVLTKHSNSHRKVMELRRQKEVVAEEYVHHGGFGMAYDHVGSSDGDDFFIEEHMGPGFSQLI